MGFQSFPFLPLPLPFLPFSPSPFSFCFSGTVALQSVTSANSEVPPQKKKHGLDVGQGASAFSWRPRVTWLATRSTRHVFLLNFSPPEHFIPTFHSHWFPACFLAELPHELHKDALPRRRHNRHHFCFHADISS